MSDDYLLPYRTDGDDLVRLLEARARGRSLDQIAALNFSRKNFDGTLVAARALGFLAIDSEDLSKQGRAFALASTPAMRRDILFGQVMSFEPYGLLLEAIVEAPESSTPTDWLERWWATHGYGSSPTNRAEASTAFARFAEFLGLGSYLQGRRGHVSRIEWAPDLKRKIRNIVANEGSGDVPEPERNEEGTTPEAAHQAPAQEKGGVYLRLPLGGSRVATVQLPARVTPAEKERLVALLEHLIVVDSALGTEGEGNEQE